MSILKEIELNSLGMANETLRKFEGHLFKMSATGNNVDGQTPLKGAFGELTPQAFHPRDVFFMLHDAFGSGESAVVDVGYVAPGGSTFVSILSAPVTLDSTTTPSGNQIKANVLANAQIPAGSSVVASVEYTAGGSATEPTWTVNVEPRL